MTTSSEANLPILPKTLAARMENRD